MTCLAPDARRAARCLAAVVLAAAVASPRAEPLAVGKPFALSAEHPDGERFMGVRLLGTVEIEPLRFLGLRPVGLSGLAWDADEQRLYALSDLGVVFHLAPRIEGGRLRGVDILHAAPLRDARGRPLSGHDRDGEGLEVLDARNGRPGDTRLVVAFERRPRIETFRPDGTRLEALALPPALRAARVFDSPNRALEAITHHPALGLLTAPEWPIRGSAPATIAIHGLAGGTWRYPRRASDSALVALESLPDGTLIALERGFSSIWSPVVIALRRARIEPATDPPATLAVEDVAVFDSSRGWRIDNFEGLAWHEGLRFFLVSDDNDRAYQRTLLLYLELVDASGSSAP